MPEKQEILFGTGDLYIVDVDENGSEVETKVGESNGEAALNIEYDTHDVRGGAKHQLLKVFQTNETINFNAGIVTYSLKTISEFIASRYIEDTEAGTRTLEIGGGFDVKVQKLRFVHTKEDGKKITMNMHKAMNSTGLEWSFNGEENSAFEFEFRLMKDAEKNNIVEIIEEI